MKFEMKALLVGAAPMTIWFLAVVIGLAMLLFANDHVPLSATATKDLTNGTLIQTGDWEVKGLTGRHVVASTNIKSGAVLRAEDISDQPVDATARSGELTISFPLDPAAAAGTAKAGDKLQLCGKPPKVFGNLVVETLTCSGSGTARKCSAAVSVPNKVAADLIGAGLKDNIAMSELNLAKTCTPGAGQ